jgi:hypothetical protein
VTMPAVDPSTSGNGQGQTQSNGDDQISMAGSDDSDLQALVDPFNRDFIPFYRSQNPLYLVTTPADQFMEIPPDARSFTSAAFPLVNIPHTRLFAKVIREQRKDIIREAKDHGTAFAVVPFGAEATFYEKNPGYIQAVRESLVELGGPEARNISVFLAQKVTKNVADKFGNDDIRAPYILLVSDAPSQLTDVVTKARIFCFGDQLVYQVQSLDWTEPSWVLANFRSDPDFLTNDEDRMKDALIAIKRKLYGSTIFKNWAVKVGDMEHRPVDILMMDIISSLDLHFIHMVHKETGADQSVYQVLAKPITHAVHWHELSTKVFRNITFLFRAHIFRHCQVNCRWCKSDTHPGHQCPFYNIPGWLASKPTDRKNDDETSDSDKSDVEEALDLPRFKKVERRRNNPTKTKKVKNVEKAQKAARRNGDNGKSTGGRQAARNKKNTRYDPLD